MVLAIIQLAEEEELGPRLRKIDQGLTDHPALYRLSDGGNI